jgi:hypothetical protein
MKNAEAELEAKFKSKTFISDAFPFFEPFCVHLA